MYKIFRRKLKVVDLDAAFPNINTSFGLNFQKPSAKVCVILWCPIKMRVFHQIESCLSCLHPPLSYEARREQGRQLSFDEKLNLIGH